jgi:hypothetical protein
MAHISSLSSGIFTYLDFYNQAPASTVDTAAEYAGLFVTANASNVKRIPSVREFPSIGTPANIVNVPVYGQSTSSQVQGQSDAPTLEVTVNYVPDDMDDFHALIGTQGAFRFMMCSQATTLAASLDTATTALTYGNTEFYFKGKIEAILVNPALTDATTATVTMSTQSDFFGPVTLP